jgi:uncharacterized protein (UPF0254 family)
VIFKGILNIGIGTGTGTGTGIILLITQDTNSRTTTNLTTLFIKLVK